MTSAQQPRPARRHFSRTMFHGSINFEQQKKRAKELLKSLKQNDRTARGRLEKQHPNTLDLDTGTADIKLADCQLVIARENGFASWPQLKAHCDRLYLRKSQIASGNTPQLDNENTLHIRCGWDIKHGLEIAGFIGDFHEFSDPFCQGPVPEESINTFYEIRTKFISDAYGLPIKEIRTKQKLAYDKLGHLYDYDHVVLWFEHDSYDQLILACLLSHISEMLSRPAFELICVNEVPGVPDFVGLGQLAPEMLIWLWENRRIAITDAQVELGTTVWKALRAKTPEGLQDIISSRTPDIPPMAVALERHLQELPAKLTGLSLTQQLALEIINDHEPIKGVKIFARLMREREPLPFLGDLMFWHVLSELAQAKDPLISYEKTTTPTPWPERLITLTSTGNKVLKGELDYLDLIQSERWVGGIKITPQTACPRRAS